MMAERERGYRLMIESITKLSESVNGISGPHLPSQDRWKQQLQQHQQ